MRIKEATDKYNLIRSGERVKDALIMLKRNIDKLGLLDEQDARLLTLAMDNLFGEILTVVEVVKGLKKEVTKSEQ